MRHHSRNKKFGRESAQRKALISSLARSFVLHEKIKTTEAKAKALRPYVERLVTHGKKGTIASRRLIAGKIGGEASKRMVDTIAPKYKSRAGGYTRITKLPVRLSDGALMALIEFV
ncbi:MAG: 50S ribosomal protein L17 [Patescibacteria group bacterium]